MKTEKERERTGYEPFALHAPIQCAVYGDVIRSRGRSNVANARHNLHLGSYRRCNARYNQ